MTKWSTETAAEICEHCRRPIWADLESELYVDRDDEFECPAAPREVNAAGAQYGTMPGCHVPG